MGFAVSDILRFPFFFLLLFPFFFTAYRWVRGIFPRRVRWRCTLLAAPLGFALIMVSVGVLGRAWGNFYQGLWCAWGVVLLAGIFLYRHQRVRQITTSFEKKNWHWRPSDVLFLFFLLASTFLIALVAYRYGLYDEMGIQGHASLTEVLLRGFYPPPFLSFSEIPNRYHFGFNLVTAVFAHGLNLSAVHAIDVLTVVLWVLLCGLTVEICIYWDIPRSAWPWTLILLFLTGGLSWLLASRAPGPAQVPHWQEMYLYGRYLHQNFTNYFFQHPMGLGAVLFIPAFQCFSDYFDRPETKKLALAILFLGALSLAQVMFFSTLLAALGLVFFFRFFQKGQNFLLNLGAGLQVLVLSLFLAFLLGGFFQFSNGNYENFPVRIAWPPDYLSFEYWGRGRYEVLTPLRYVLWYLSSFGLLLLFVPWAWILGFRQRRLGLYLLGFFSLLCLLVSQCLYYPYSGNIRKWFLGFELSAKMLVAITLLPIAFRRSWSRILAVTLILFSSVAPLRYLGDLAFKSISDFRGAEKRLAYTRHQEPRGPMLALVRQLKSCEDCHGRIWSSEELTPYLAIHTGRFLLEMDRSLRSMPVARALIRARQQDLNDLRRFPTLDLLNRLQVEWVVFSCEDFSNLPEVTRVFLQELRGASVDFSGSSEGVCLVAFQRRLSEESGAKAKAD